MVKVIAGLMGSAVASGSPKFATPEQLSPLLTLLSKRDVNELDTARVYGGGKNEEVLGLTSSSSDFAIATKAPAFGPGTLTYDEVIRNCNASLAALKRDKIDLYYFHGPDRQTPLQESCRAIQDLYTQGKFVRWGISNLHVDEVTSIIDICAREGWVKPSVYQGGYNPLLRGVEEPLLPKLREYGIAFYAYLPLGGGFFSKPVEQLKEPPTSSRRDLMLVFSTLYVNELSLELLGDLRVVYNQDDFQVLLCFV
ncbi:Aldo/keto reductase [Hortaea werneckii]|uniref:NADP-dependent oxidoreductase domain-containing protein n=1 Tax=Hortaea werneckii TaxID=91943 RepID=A0A3M7A736_HORWE|nr:Aldo/keto reductase [Hortaea werneckii]KAI7003004.1 Aldo/keto reductase [Hortaea werneckii]KAI7661398.1 Aldo/keto reductase [Hortaea werneckii]RMY00166.1 hypothetical protein D0867_11842 [Hortaea werneckii]RMY23237.1 hypothetical protein D0866_11719 [Hortaea werneckii]